MVSEAAGNGVGAGSCSGRGEPRGWARTSSRIGQASLVRSQTASPGLAGKQLAGKGIPFVRGGPGGPRRGWEAAVRAHPGLGLVAAWRLPAGTGGCARGRPAPVPCQPASHAAAVEAFATRALSVDISRSASSERGYLETNGAKTR